MRFGFLACITFVTSLVSALPPPITRQSARPLIVRFKTGAVEQEKRGTWIQNQLRKADLPALDQEELDAFKLGWEPTVFDGFSGSLSQAAAEAFLATGDVEFIEEDGEAWVSDITTQTDAPWGLQRISQISPLTNQNDAGTSFTYTFDDSAGEGVAIYIVDTGVQVTHAEFEDRASFVFSTGPGTPNEDIHGHGTHVAGIAASRAFGVSKKASIFAVKVMADNGRGSSSDIVAGVNFAVRHARQTRQRAAVINISIITNVSRALDEAVENAVSAGINVVCGAGNDNLDAGDFSPARSPGAITVGAIDIRDQRAPFSNFGDVVDVFAPGVNILSTYIGAGDQNTRVQNGTSMATPFVTGVVAYMLGLDDSLTPSTIRRSVQALAGKDVLSLIPSGTLNEVLYNGAQGSGDGSETSPPEENDLTDGSSPVQQGIIASIEGVISMFRALSDAAALVGA